MPKKKSPAEPRVRCMKITKKSTGVSLYMDVDRDPSEDMSQFRDLTFFLELPDEVGDSDTYTFKMVSMTKEERDAMPDFDGF